MAELLDQKPSVLCPLVTPFRDGAVDVNTLESLISHLLDAGIDGMVPCGTSGEVASLSNDDYREVVTTTTRVADGVPVIAGATGTAIERVLDRVQIATEAGVDGVLIPPPYYHTATDSAGLERFYRSVADESQVPIYLYDIPSCTGQPLSPATVASLAEHETIVGVKDSSGNFEQFTTMLRRTPDEFRVYQGFDTQLVPSLIMGANGGICGASNVVPEAYPTLLDAVGTGELERVTAVQQSQIGPLFQHALEVGIAPTLKVAAAARGYLPSTEVRPPLTELDEEVRAEIVDTVETAVAELA